MRCDPSLSSNQLNYDAQKFPCDGSIQFQHLFYQPKDEDDGKQLSCSLDENGDTYPEYFSTPLNLRVKPRENELNGLNSFGNGDEEAEDKEELQVDFIRPWGQTRLRLSKLSCYVDAFISMSLSLLSL